MRSPHPAPFRAGFRGLADIGLSPDCGPIPCALVARSGANGMVNGLTVTRSGGSQAAYVPLEVFSATDNTYTTGADVMCSAPLPEPSPFRQRAPGAPCRHFRRTGLPPPRATGHAHRHGRERSLYFRLVHQLGEPVGEVITAAKNPSPGSRPGIRRVRQAC